MVSQGVLVVCGIDEQGLPRSAGLLGCLVGVQVRLGAVFAERRQRGLSGVRLMSFWTIMRAWRRPLGGTSEARRGSGARCI